MAKKKKVDEVEAPKVVETAEVAEAPVKAPKKEFFDGREVWKKEEVSVGRHSFVDYWFLDGTKTRELK